jgi:hypothetical protein
MNAPSFGFKFLDLNLRLNYMNSKIFLILAIAFSFVAGHILTRISPPQTTLAQESNKPRQSERILVKGFARAITSLESPTPHEEFSFTAEGSAPFFKKVPKGKKFVLTDIMLHPQGSVLEPITVNIGGGSAGLLTQIRIEPNKSKQTSLCSGYVVSEGESLTAYTGWGKPRQFVSVFVTGYLMDEQDKQK